MREMQRAEQFLARTEEEILAARAEAMRRIAATLERQLAELAHLRDAAGAASGPERERRAEAYRRLRERARLQRWFLVVQREAMGLRDHTLLGELYPLPGPLTP